MNVNNIYLYRGSKKFKRIIFPFVDDIYNKDFHETKKIVDRVAIGIKRDGKAVLIDYGTEKELFKSKILDFLKPLKFFEAFRINYDFEEFLKTWTQKTIEAMKKLRKERNLARLKESPVPAFEKVEVPAHVLN